MISPKHAANLAGYADKVIKENARASIDAASLEEIVYPPKATEISQGVTLFTRNGSHTGNAIVVQKVENTIRCEPGQEAQDVWLIETDFGNQCRLTVSEIHTLFTLGRKSSYTRWFDDRLELIAKRTAEL